MTLQVWSSWSHFLHQSLMTWNLQWLLTDWPLRKIGISSLQLLKLIDRQCSSLACVIMITFKLFKLEDCLSWFIILSFEFQLPHIGHAYQGFEILLCQYLIGTVKNFSTSSCQHKIWTSKIKKWSVLAFGKFGWQFVFQYKVFLQCLYLHNHFCFT
jgi:hypothetical protein